MVGQCDCHDSCEQHIAACAATVDLNLPKSERLARLADLRRHDRLPPHSGFGDFHDGLYDRHPYVVPWSISAHNVECRLMIMGQDWNSAGRLHGPFDQLQAAQGQIPNLRTNVRLRALLFEHLGMRFEDTYATDLFAFAKQGPMTAPIPSQHLRYSARCYAVPQIRIIRPRIVMCLGARTFNALCHELGPDLVHVRLRDACGVAVPLDNGETEIMVVPHTGAWANGIANVSEYWEAVAQRLNA